MHPANRKSGIYLSSCAAIALFGVAGAAPVMAAADASAEAADIVVTAQRKSESIQKVPVSVVAFNAETLQNKVITSEQDIGSLVPGLVVKNGQTSNQLSYSMRGQTLDPFSGTSPAVLTYLNEVPYITGNTATPFFDLGSIQVVKGPQGTLFGRNATGGAVLYSTPTPGNELGGYLTARVGERKAFQLQGAVDLPLVVDKIAIRLAGDYTKANGYMRNIATGNTLGDKDSKSGRLTLLLTPTETIKNTFIIQYSDIGGTEGSGNLYNYYTSPGVGGAQYINNGITSVQNNNGYNLTSTLDTVYNVFSGVLFNRAGNNLGDSNLTPGPAYGPGRFPGGVAGYAAWSRAHPYSTWLQFDTPHKAKSTFLSNTTEFDLSDALKIKNIVGYLEGTSRVSGNLAGGPFGGLWLYNEPNNPTGLSGDGGPGGQTFKSKSFSEEFQIQGELADGKLDYTAGLFYNSTRKFEIIPVHVGSEIDPTLGAAAAFGLPADIDYTYRTKNISKAVYAQLGYDITDRLKLTLGGRYTWEDVRLVQSVGSLFTILGLADTVTPQRRKLSAPAWNFNLQYQASNSVMVYFSQRGSFRSGNFNGTVTPFNNNNFFRNEYAHDFELGFKYSGFVGGMPVRFNTAIYEQIVKKAQHAVYAVIGGNPAGFTLNVPESTTKGIEVDGAASLLSWLDIGFNVAYTDAKYTKGNVDVSALTGVPGYIIPFDSYPDTPKWSGTVSAEIKLPVPESIGKMSLHGDVYSQSSSYFSSNEGSVTPGTRLAKYTTVNARYSWKEILQSKVSLGIYVKNLFDKMYYVSGYAMGAAGGYNTAYPGEPQTFGAELSIKF